MLSRDPVADVQTALMNVRFEGKRNMPARILIGLFSYEGGKQ